MSLYFPSKLSLKIMVTLLIPIMLMGGAFFALFAYNNASWHYHGEITHQVHLMKLFLKGLDDVFIRQDNSYLKSQLMEFSHEEGVARIRWLTKEGKVLFDSQGKISEGKMLASDQECLLCHQAKKIEFPHSVAQVSLADKAKLLRHFIPLTNQSSCQACHPGKDKILGFFLVDFRQPKIDKQRIVLLIQLALSSLVTILVISLILYITLRRMIDHPIRQIISRMRGISVISGDLRHIEFSSQDEIGEVVDLINDLSEKLKHSKEELASLYQAKDITSTLDFEKNILASLTVAEVMDTSLEVIYEDMTIREIMKFLKNSRRTFFPVINHKGSYVGVITLHEIRNVLIEQDLDHVCYARDFYRSDIPYIFPSSTLKEATDLVLAKDRACLPVVEEGTGILVGLLDQMHIFQILKRELLKRVGV